MDVKRKVRSLTLAFRLGHKVCVMRPHKYHPYPNIGWRLFIWHPEGGWIHIMFGAQEVLDKMADKQNTTFPERTLLK